MQVARAKVEKKRGEDRAQTVEKIRAKGRAAAAKKKNEKSQKARKKIKAEMARADPVLQSALVRKLSEFDELAVDELSAPVAGGDADGVSDAAITDDSDNQDDVEHQMPSSCNERPA